MNAFIGGIMGMGGISGYRKEYAPMALSTKIGFLCTVTPFYYLRIVANNLETQCVRKHFGYLSMGAIGSSFFFCLGSFIGRELYRGRQISIAKGTEGGS